MRRLILTFYLLACLPTLAYAAVEIQQSVISPDASLDVYASPNQRVEIDGGRSLNLRCSGKGEPIVLLEAGFGADSLAWSKLQPLLATRMRVCSYDRAGYGFSDAGPLPRNLEAEVSDLHALIRAADISVPVVLVGHSMGSNIARRYDQLHPKNVAALVLIDPPPQGVGTFSPAYAKAETEMAPAMLQAYRSCEQGAKDGKLAAPPPELQRCLRGPNPAYSDQLNAVIRNYKSTPAFWQTIISASEAKMGLFDAPIPPDEKHGDKPLVVLTAVDAYAEVEASDRKALEAAQKQTHVALALSSTAGKRVSVPKTSHDLQLDKPEAVFDAVVSVRQATKRP